MHVLCVIADHSHEISWLVLRLRHIVFTRDLGLKRKCPLWGSFYGILARIYWSFGENHGKLRTPRWTSTMEDRIRHLSSSSLSFENRISRLLVRHTYRVHFLLAYFAIFIKSPFFSIYYFINLNSID